jgi:hypothetical protein
MPKGFGYNGTKAEQAIGGKTTGRAGTAAGSASKSGKTVKAGARRVGGSSNSARQPSVHKRGS